MTAAELVFVLDWLGLRVKPLVWVKNPTSDAWRCDTVIGKYKVWGIGPTPSWDFDSLTEHVSHSTQTVEVAIAACNAHRAAQVAAMIERIGE